MSIPAPILQYSLAEATVKGLLPAGYTPLAYIENTGSSYIDTGWKYTDGDVTVDIEYTKPTNSGCTVIGSSNNNTKWFLLIYNSSTASVHYCGTQSGIWATTEASGNKIHATYSISGLNVTLTDNANNSVSTSCGTIPSQTYTYTVFCHNNGGTKNLFAYCKVYHLLIVHKENLVIDLRPARRDSDGAIGMYDLVSCSFKANSGSGTFVAGPPLAIGKDGGKSLPEEYLQVEYVGSTYASGTVYPVYRKSDMLPGTYNTSTSAFTTVSGTIGPTINAGYTWEPNAGSGTQQGLYTNLSGIYDSSKGWVADFTTNTSHLSTTITAVGNTFSVAWWELSSNFNNNSMPWSISPFNPFYNKCLNTSDGGNNPWYVPGTTTAVANITDNVWHHFVVTGNGTANYLYVDGVKYGLSKTFKGLTGTALNLNGSTVSSTNYCRNPKITNFQIFNVALTDAQVKELYGQ